MKSRISNTKRGNTMTKHKNVNIKMLERPTKRSGYELHPGAKTSVRGLVIVNTNRHSVFIDKWTPFYQRKARASK